MAARFEVLRGEEEGDADAVAAPQGAPAAGRGGLLVRVLGASALVGAAVAGLAHLGPSGSGARVAGLGGIESKAEVSPEEAQTRFHRRTKLEIEKDLSEVVNRHLPRGATPGGDVSAKQAAGTLFEHVVHATGLHKELTKHEKTAFKTRFVDAMSAEPVESGEDSALKYVRAAQKHLESQKPVVTQALAKSINKLDLGFTLKAEEWMLPESKALFQKRLGRLPRTKEQVQKLKDEGRIPDTKARSAVPRDPLPEDFDCREHWSECAELIGDIKNQGHCGSCWAFGALGALDSRMCIATLGAAKQFNGEGASLSRGVAASCSVHGDGCQGGLETMVYDYIEHSHGIPTTGCSPYFATGAGQEHFEQTQEAPACPRSCGNTEYPRSFLQDSFRPHGVGHYNVVVQPSSDDIEFIKRCIYSDGPVSFAFSVSNEFFGYESGIWSLGCGDQPNHAVHCIAWGKDYMLAQNSWSAAWGDKGRFKFKACVAYEFTVPGPFHTNSLMRELPVPEHKSA